MTSSRFERTGEPEQTELIGDVADQAALVGIINALYNYGHTVVSVELIPPDTDPHMDHTKEEAWANDTVYLVIRLNSFPHS